MTLPAPSGTRTRWPGFACLAALALALSAAGAGEWRPAQGPLFTRYAADLSPTNAHTEYPRPQLVRREWLNLNGLWQYAILGATDPQPTNYDGSILVPFPVEAALSGVARRLGETNRLWYRRTVEVPIGWAERRVRLHFGAVDWHARVLVNGNYAGQHRGGYDAFSLDITPHLKWNGQEEIVVTVQDPTEGEQPRGKQSRSPEGIFYTPSSGIWQTVWLEPVPRARIDNLRLTPDVDGRALKLHVSVNRLSELFRVEAVALENGVEVGRIRGAANVELELRFDQPRLWSPADPFLYDLRVTLSDADSVQDEVTSYFGMRKLSVRKDENGIPRLALNGEFLFQIGILDQGFWPDGLYTAPADAAWRDELKLVKDLGFNLVRKHVKVEPARWYHWCDQLGLLVWQDMPSGNNLTAAARQQFEIELQRMIESLYNHPSIVTWVLFNEGWGQYDTARLVSWLQRLDPSRLVNNASGWIDKRVGDLADLHSYPGPEPPGAEASRAMVLGEFGGVGLAVPGHTWSPKIWGYEVVETQDQLTGRYRDLFDRAWSLNEQSGLSAAIYTQLSDVETECNGLITYDRAVVKPDRTILLASNLGQLREPPTRVLLQTGGHGRAPWRYTLQPPPPDWHLRGFDMSRWLRGRSGFGSRSPGLPANLTRTAWNTPEIWLRRLFVLPSKPQTPVLLRARCAGVAQVYLNGVLAGSISGQGTDYLSLPISPEAAATLRDGVNLMAVHARRTGTNQFIDVGLASVSQPAKAPQ